MCLYMCLYILFGNLRKSSEVLGNLKMFLPLCILYSNPVHVHVHIQTTNLFCYPIALHYEAVESK